MGLKLPDLAIVKIKIITSHRKTSTLTIHFSSIVPAFTIQTPKAQLSMWYMLKWWYNYYMHEAKGEFIIIHSEYVDIITAS